jgi:carboxypeptidase PM20D1
MRLFCQVPAFLFVLTFLSCSSAKPDLLQQPQEEDDPELDEGAVLNRLSKAVQFQTVSYEDRDLIDYAPYNQFLAFIEAEFPELMSAANVRQIGGYSMLIEWSGIRSDYNPILLMGHYDVVPVSKESEEFWEYGPFSGEIADGFVWGRGSLDDKSGVMSILEAAENLAKQGWMPERTVFIALNHDEEIGGQYGAKLISHYFENSGIELEFLVDEGPPIAIEIIEGVDVPLAMIGVAEKGSVNIELYYNQEGGHSSMPPRTSVISTLSRAVNRIERRSMKGYYGGLLVETFEPVIPYMTFSQRLAFNNSWLFKGLIKSRLSRNPATNAALRTTAAKTIFEAGFKENVLPVEGRVIINFRIHPNNSISDVEEYVRRRVRNNNIQIRVLDRAREASPVTRRRTAHYRMLKGTIEDSFNPVLVSPTLFVAASDSRHFHNLTPHIFRFRPIRASHDDRRRVHGIDERIRIENYLEMIHFQMNLIKNGSALGITTPIR